MTGSRALVDTNILIDFLNGLPSAQLELALYDTIAISRIAWMEVLAGLAAEHQTGARAFLGNCDVLPIDDAVAEETVRLRRSRRLKLPDAIVLATAITRKLILVTRNTRDFDNDEQVRVPYRL